MEALLIEALCPRHGLERFSIKIVRKFNMPKKEITPEFRTHPKHSLSRITVGRAVTEEAIRAYVMQYLEKRSYLERILKVEPVKI